MRWFERAQRDFFFDSEVLDRIFIFWDDHQFIQCHSKIRRSSGKIVGCEKCLDVVHFLEVPIFFLDLQKYFLALKVQEKKSCTFERKKNY